MKKLLLIALCMCFLAPSQAAANGFSGIYVAPKLAGSFVSTPEGFINFDAIGVVGEKTKSDDMIDDILYSGALAIGYDFNAAFNFPVRTEVEYSFFSQFNYNGDFTNSRGMTNPVDIEMNIQTVFINAYYDFHNSSKFTPYVGLGLGLALVSLGAGLDAGLDPGGLGYEFFGKKTQTNFAWNVGVGSSYAFTDAISLDLAYRYAQLGKAETKKLDIYGSGNIGLGSTDTISAHQIMLGIRYSF